MIPQTEITRIATRIHRRSNRIARLQAEHEADKEVLRRSLPLGETGVVTVSQVAETRVKSHMRSAYIMVRVR